MGPMIRLAILAAAVLGVCAEAQAGQLMVMSDSATFGYALGTVLEEGTAVKVPDGQRLALIDSSGKGVTIRGPFEGGIQANAAAGPATLSVMAALQTIIHESGRQSLAVVREGHPPEAPPDARFLDINGDATECVAPGQPVEMWRAPPRPRALLFVTRLSTGARAQIDWPSSQETLSWPGNIEFVDGETYQVAVQGALVKPRLVIHLLSFAEPGIDAAKRLADAGCGGQAMTMLETIADAAGDH